MMTRIWTFGMCIISTALLSAEVSIRTADEEQKKIIIEVLKNRAPSNNSKRYNYIYEIGKVGHVASFAREALTEIALNHEEEVSLRKSAISSIGALGSSAKESISNLEALSNEKVLKMPTLSALIKIAGPQDKYVDQLLAILDTGNPKDIIHALGVIQANKLNGEVVRTNLKLLHEKSGDGEIRKECLICLSHCAAESKYVLEMYMNSNDFSDYDLGRMGSPVVEGGVIKLIESKSNDDRIVRLIRLSYWKQGDVGKLANKAGDLLSIPDKRLQLESLKLLAHLRVKSDSTCKGVLALIDKFEPDLKLQAIITLGRIGSGNLDAGTKLMHYRYSGNKDERDAAAKGLIDLDL